MPVMRVARWVIAIFGGVLVALWIVAFAGSRTSVLHEKLVQTLSDKLHASVELDTFRVRTFPRLRISGDGLRIRLKDQQQPQPLIAVDHFEVSGGIIGLLRRQRHFRSVELDGLRITVPPRSGHDREAGNEAAQAAAGPVLIDRVTARNAALVLVPKTAGKDPRVFQIHDLAIESVGFNRPMSFTAKLINPVPRGDIAVGGSFGPWRADEPGLTPLSGRYEFTNADLSTIRGIAGMLSSSGDFGGELMEIDVRGTTHTPDFAVDTGAHPVPLDTTFHAVVDGTNGDTYLKRVDAKFVETSLTASGAITGEKGRKGRTIALDVHMPRGRIEDVLALAVRTAKPVMSGTIALETSMKIPPGELRVADRIELDGRFALEQARFTDRLVQQKIATLSSRARGHDPDDGLARVLSGMHGAFIVKDGRARFNPVAFDVPGAAVVLRGSYGLRTEQLAFDGTLEMDATVSQAAGGVKGFFLKVVDPLFKRNGAGAVVPIHVTGTREKPKFGLDWKRALLRK
jgi:hypothetical protein